MPAHPLDLRLDEDLDREGQGESKCVPVTPCVAAAEGNLPVHREAGVASQFDPLGLASPKGEQGLAKPSTLSALAGVKAGSPACDKQVAFGQRTAGAQQPKAAELEYDIGSKPRDVSPLFGLKPPKMDMQSEKGWHRTAAYLFATGKSNIYIAEALDKSPQQVGNVVRQPWFKKHVAEIIAEYRIGADAQAVLNNAALKAAQRLIDLIDSDKDSIALPAANSLLDRVLGRAVQKTVNLSQPLPQNILDEAASLEDSIKRLLNPRSVTITSASPS